MRNVSLPEETKKIVSSCDHDMPILVKTNDHNSAMPLSLELATQPEETETGNEGRTEKLLHEKAHSSI